MINRYTVLFTIIFLFLSLSFLPGENVLAGDVSIELREPEVLESLPGESQTFSYRINNATDKELRLTGEIDLPSGFTRLTPPVQFTLAPGESTVNLVNLHIAGNTAAGDYNISYQVVEGEEIKAQRSESFTVLPQLKLEASVRKVPARVIAGAEYEGEYRLRNTGNIAVDVDYALEDREGYIREYDREEISLVPGESEIITVSAETDRDINREITHRVSLEAEGRAEEEVIEAGTTSSVDVLPRMTGDDDPYHRLPLTLGGDLSYRGDLGVQFDLAATGPINVEEERWVDVFIRPPALEITGDEFSEDAPEYRFSYWDDKSRIDVGDHRFSLSDLTEKRFTGRGLSLSTEKIEGFELGAYYRWDRDFDFEDGGGAIHADYYPDEEELDLPLEDTGLKAGYLNREREDKREQMFTLGGDFTAGEEHEFELEYARGLGEFTGQAFSGDVEGSHEDLSYGAGYLRADPDFPGDRSDRESYNASLGYDFVPEFSLSGSYGHRRDNLDLDPDREADKRDGISIEGSFSYEDTRFDLSRSQTWQKDRREDPEFDEEEVAWEGVLRQSFTDVDLRTSYRRTWVDDLLEGAEKTYDRFRVRVDYTPADWHNYRADYRLRINEEETKHWGSLSADFEVREDIDLELDYSRWHEEENDEEEESTRDRFTASVSRDLPEQQAEVSLRGRYTRRENGDGEFSVRAEYSQDISFGLPVGRRPVGRLAGRLYDAEDPAEPGLADVIVRVDGMTAVTDEDGYYTFPDLEPGTYYLQIDRGTLEPGHIVDEKMPLPFSIEAEEEKEIDLGVVEGASISGQALVYVPVGTNNNFNNNNLNNNNLQGEAGDNNSIILNQGVEMEPDYGLGGLQIVLRNEENGNTEVEYTDFNGEFSFNGLRPGSWELVVNDNGNLPRHHELEEDAFTFDIEPGEEIDDVEIKVVPTERELEFIDEGEILNPNNNDDE